MLSSSRPRSVTITALGGLLLGGWNLWRVIVLAGRRALLNALDTSLDPLWRLIIAFIWVVLFTGAAAAIWQRRPRARWLFPLLLSCYAGYHFALLAFFVQSPLARRGWAADLVLYVIVWLASVWSLSRPGVRHYWRAARRL